VQGTRTREEEWAIDRKIAKTLHPKPHVKQARHELFRSDPYSLDNNNATHKAPALVFSVQEQQWFAMKSIPNSRTATKEQNPERAKGAKKKT